LVLFISLAVAHPALYPHVKRLPLDPSTPPQILSWHVHIVYNLASDITERALQLRDKTILYFQAYLGPECPHRFDDGLLCMIVDHNFTEVLTEGPFPAGEWSMFVPTPYLALVVPWLIQNRGEFDLLLHPNSGYMYEDHSIWASWSGQAWPLNMETLGDPGEKTNEFNNTYGDEDNPSCLPQNTVCGDSQSGPTTTCCSGLSCIPEEETHVAHYLKLIPAEFRKATPKLFRCA